MEYITSILVPAEFDVADERIANELHEGDLIITADIPLAAEVIDRGGHALKPHGEFCRITGTAWS